MKKLFGKDVKKEFSVASILESDKETYVHHMKDVYFISGIRFDSESKDKLSAEFEDSINYFKEYMEAKFPYEVLSSGNAVNINEEDMLAKAPDYTKRLFMPVRFNDLIYINRSNQFAHMHTDGEMVTEMEGVHLINGLNRKLQQEKINGIFAGMTVEEAAAMLEQMRLLDKENSELVKAIFINKVYKSIRSIFFKDIIYKILSENTLASVTRARLFADTYGIEFDFNAYERNFGKTKDLLLQKKDC